jgi:hypothetical protein
MARWRRGSLVTDLRCIEERPCRGSSLAKSRIQWGTAEKPGEPPQVLRGCGEQHIAPDAAQPHSQVFIAGARGAPTSERRRLFDASSTFVVVYPNTNVDATPVTRESLTLDFRVGDFDVR